MTFDWTITFGTVLAAVTIVAGTWATASRLYSLVDKRLSLFQHTLEQHAATLLDHATRMEKQDTMHAATFKEHAARMEKQDEMLLRISGDLQRLIGRMEVWTDKRRRDDVSA